MAEIIINTKIIPRHDLSSTWTLFNPTLLKGEIGFEIDTGKMKIGDGEHNWDTLPYSHTGIPNEEIDSIFKK